MRYLLLLSLCIVITSCNSNKKHDAPTWIIGKWIKANNEGNNKTYEVWNPDFSGKGFTLQEKDTLFVENMRLITKDNTVFFRITNMGELPNYFKLTQQSENSFTVENQQNSFPKKIKYTLDKDTLTTVISNNEFSVDFKFTKLK